MDDNMAQKNLQRRDQRLQPLQEPLVHAIVAPRPLGLELLLPEAEAQSRVDAAVNEARDLEIKAREQADKARRAAIITGFIAAASLLISLVAACYFAGIGGRHRNEGRSPLFHGHRFW